jgi:DNA-binding transcriptional regulator GbsR (MarR family)
VQLWGEMATHWGINRTMAQVHALLFASPAPLDTDTIMARLDVSRGNANTNLRRLVEWGLVRRVRQRSSRRDLYEAETDVWKVTSRIIREREQREIEPLAQRLDACRKALSESEVSPDAAHFAARLDDLLAFVRLFSGVSAALAPLLERRNAGLVSALVAFARALPRDTGRAS